MRFRLPAIALLLAALSISSIPTRAAAPATPPPSPAASPRITLNFDSDWRFFKGEPPAPPTTQPTHGNYPPVDPPSFAFKDDTWQKVTLPHDWSIEGPFDENAPSLAAGAFLPTGISWYRKTFTLPPEAKGKKVFIEFDGVMANSEVYINKGLLGSRPNGYVGFSYDMTDYLDFNGPNLLAVRTDTSRQPASRWYAGAGIYRHVRLVIENSIHMEHDSTSVITTVDGDHATAHFKTTIVNQTNEPHTLVAFFGAYNSNGLPIPSNTAPPTPQLVPAGKSAIFTSDVPINNPNLWSVENPYLYGYAVSVNEGSHVNPFGQDLDLEHGPFGIRTAEFKADTGFYLNGKNLKLLGVALHNDAGALGSAVPLSAWESRLTELKKYGVNAIRTAHAPMAPEFYDLCDRLGLLVMDEAFDAWTVGKEPADYHLYFKDWWQRDLTSIIESHRNHPSVILYSLGNEIWDVLPQNPDPALDQFTGPMRSIDVAKTSAIALRDLAHALDPSRPVTMAVMRPNVNHTYDNGFSEIVDVIGQNYRDNELAAAHRANPARKILGTEDYKTRDTWLALRDNPALAGQFLWAGVDYLGESARWPNIFSPSGLLDHTNAPKGDALEREAWWVKDRPVLHLARMQTVPTRPGAAAVTQGFPDWSPENKNPHTETVSAYSNCDEVELFLNDQSLGTKPKDKNDAPRQWQIPFTPGTLRAIAKNANQQVATDQLKTAGPPAKILLQAEHDKLPNDWDDIDYIRATITDADGTPIPTATNPITFQSTGAGIIVATDNGALNDHDPFQPATLADNRGAFDDLTRSPPTHAIRHAYQGTCIAILRATADQGPITLTATAEGLTQGTTKIEAQPPR